MKTLYEDEQEVSGLFGFFKKIKSWYRLKRLFFKGKVRKWKQKNTEK